MLVVHRTSGDLLADRRYAYAEAALAEGDAQAAADLAEQTLERVPRFAPAWFLLGCAREALHGVAVEASPSALNAFATALDLDPDDALGARLRLARLTGEDRGALSPAYVRTLFDAYAPRFERHLVETLGYCGPERITSALAAVTGEPLPRFPRVLDLGCGTGLMARALAGVAGEITGVDLAPAMLAVARRTGSYARLVEAEFTAFLAGEPAGSADLIVAADAVPYLGPLDPFLRGAASALTPGGLLAFTAQTHEGAGIVLGEDARFAHGVPAIRKAAEAAGLGLRHVAHASVRREGERDVPGVVVVLARPRE